MYNVLWFATNVGEDICKLGDESLALCDKLKEGGDTEEKIRHSRYKIEVLKMSAIEQLKEKTKTNEMLLADLRKLEASSIPVQLGAGEGTKVAKTEPPSLGVEEFSTLAETSRSLETMVYICCSVMLVFVCTYSCCCHDNSTPCSC